MTVYFSIKDIEKLNELLDIRDGLNKDIQDIFNTIQEWVSANLIRVILIVSVLIIGYIVYVIIQRQLSYLEKHKKLEELIDWCYKSYYFRFSYVIKRLRSISSFRELSENVKIFWNFFVKRG